MLAIVFLPGVIIHELAHLIMAGVLFVPTGTIEFFPQLHGDQVKLGSVQVAKTDIFRRMLIGVAPVLVGGGMLWGILLFLVSLPQLFSMQDWWVKGMVLYGIFVLANTMFSSKKDMEGAGEFFIVVIVIWSFLYLLGVEFPDTFYQFFTEQHWYQQVMVTIFVLSIPLLMNVSVYCLARLIGKRFM